mgnify:CR=1 FL=1
MKRTLLLVLLACLPLAARAQPDAPELTLPCWYRASDLDQPWTNTADVPCLEEVINDPSAGELGFTALAVAPDNTLYALRPLLGQVMALTDGDGDYLPESARVLIDGLTMPTALAYHDGALYLVDGARLYRWADDALETLADDLPAGTGYGVGGLLVGDDERLYLSIGAPCDHCVFDDPMRGVVVSYALDGSDRQIVARGLRQPGDLALLNGSLWVTDTARAGLFDMPDLDELNRIESGADFGFPGCVGANVPDLPDRSCDGTTAPALALPTHSSPAGMAAYTSDTLPALKDSLLIALAGSYNRVELRGYTVIAVQFDEAGTPHYRPILPAPPEASTPFTLDDINYRGSGVYPHRPLDVVVNAWGWVYISVGGGRILALRPQSEVVY